MESRFDAEGNRLPPPRVPAFLTRKRFYIPALLVLIAVIAGFALTRGNGQPEFETAIVERGTIVRVVSETGVIEPAEEVTLAFTASGRIASVPARKGARVADGQLLAELESAQARANLAQAQAALRAADARAGTGSGTRAQVLHQQNQLVENARIALLSGDIQAYLVSGGREGDQSYAQPSVTGTYACGGEGEYRLTLYGSSAPSGYSFSFTGIENGTGTVSTSQPMPIGQCGLYIQFPEGFVRGGGIVWSLPVPNTRSMTYAARQGAYDAAREARELALLNAENAETLAADSDQARASVRLAEALLADTRLLAPFAGLITDLIATPGQIATPGAPMLTLVSGNRFELSVAIPEDDIAGIEAGDRATVSFDAYDGVRLAAEVVYVAPRAATDNGAATFEVLLQFLEEDERLRAGLTADVDIEVDTRDDVLRVPVRAVIEEGGERFVRVMAGETAWRRAPVTVGLRGDGFYEITGGLAGGERIITFANGTALGALTEADGAPDAAPGS